MTVYERIRNRREELKLSQDEVAKKMGYKSRSSINKIELGKSDLPLSQVSCIVNILETTPSYLMGYSDIKEKKKEGAYYHVNKNHNQ